MNYRISTKEKFNMPDGDGKPEGPSNPESGTGDEK